MNSGHQNCLDSDSLTEEEKDQCEDQFKVVCANERPDLQKMSAVEKETRS